METSEVKGIWFDSARGYLLHKHGPEGLESICADLPESMHAVLREPIVAQWYPEECLGRMLAVLRRRLTDGSDADFVRVIEDITLDGVGRFFRLVLALASPRFVLRKVPVLWRRMRRGRGGVEVEELPDRMQLRYRDFPYFGDENYRLMTVATLRGIVRASGVRAPSAEAVRWTHDSFVVDVRV